MLFSSISFLYYFLPILLLIYFIVPKKFKNFVLLVSSLAFYFYGEPKYISILLLSCFISYISAILIDKEKRVGLRKIYLLISVILNISLLMYFKYTDFFIKNINGVFNTNIKLLNVVMPIGISFFTFQALSYVIDVYKKETPADRNFLSYATYLCLFPQLVAGPIVRYITVRDELKERKTTFDSFADGVSRFVIGLGKKVLLANTMGQLCEILFEASSTSVISYWIQAIGYTLQIYFDFSGYSDMAIGLGLMFGFHFLENFNYPLIASSITDFWRRWHISLSSWLRDYVYIPLGGNRVSKFKWIRNILIVWFLTGFWHGASWNFIIWGLYFAGLLLIEKLLLSKIIDKHKIISHIYTPILVIISFVIFKFEDFSEMIQFLQGMFGMLKIPIIDKVTLYYLRSYAITLIIGIIGATPMVKILGSKIGKNIRNVIEPISYVLLLIICTAYLVDASFNPFLYFRF